MKDYRELNYKYLLKQKNRTILTLGGIVLSIGLIFAIMTFLLSSRHALIEEIKNIDGKYHAIFKSLEIDEIAKIEKHIHIDRVGKSKEIGNVRLEKLSKYTKELYNIENDYRELKIIGYDDPAINLKSIKIVEGRFPRNSKEIAIENSAKDHLKKNIGDFLELKVNVEERSLVSEYKIVGFINPGYIWDGMTNHTGIIGLDENFQEGNYDIYIELEDPKDGYNKISSIGKNFNVEEEAIEYNKYLLNFYDNYFSSEINKFLFVMVTLIITIIILATIALINNSFNMSVLERIHEFGILRSVGATSRQIKSIVRREGFIIALIGIPLGILFGVLLVEFVFWLINILFSDTIVFVRSLKLILKKEVLLISGIIGFITIYISLLGPIKLTEKISPLEAIRNIRDYRKYELKGRKFTIFNRFASIETQIAYKNLERNKKRFRITVFSMTISIILFIVFSNFINFAKEISLMPSMNNTSYEIYGSIEGDWEDLYQRLKSINGVEKTYRIREIVGTVKDDKDYISNSEIISIGENIEELDKYLLEGEINCERMNSTSGVLLIKNSWIQIEETGKYELKNLTNYGVGDYIEFAPHLKNAKTIKFKIIGVLEKGLFSKIYNYNGGLSFITTDLIIDNIYEDLEDSLESESKVSMYLQVDNDNTKSIKEAIEKKIDSIETINLVDYEEIILENKIITNFASIFLYGFALIIGIIGALNIVNTINTNIAFRIDEIQLVQIIGMTKKQVKKIIVVESILYGIYSSIIGVTLGFIINFLIYELIFKVNYLDYFFPCTNILIIVLITNIVALLSGIYAANTANIGNILKDKKRFDKKSKNVL